MFANKKKLILKILDDKELYGSEIRQLSGGKLGRGTIYVILSQMEDEGLIVSREVKSLNLPLRLYKARAR